MQPDGLSSLPPVLTTYEVAELTRTTPDLWWRMAREGTAPIAPLRLGARHLRWPSAPLVDWMRAGEGGDHLVAHAGMEDE